MRHGDLLDRRLQRVLLQHFTNLTQLEFNNSDLCVFILEPNQTDLAHQNRVVQLEELPQRTGRARQILRVLATTQRTGQC